MIFTCHSDEPSIPLEQRAKSKVAPEVSPTAVGIYVHWQDWASGRYAALFC